MSTLYTLKDGSLTTDIRLDRLVQFDEQSRQYPIRAVQQAGQRRPRSYTWRVGSPFVINQGREGACVGFSVTNELIARPAEVQFNNEFDATQFARRVYFDAQRIDPWPGGAYPGASPRYEGTSVLAGVKIAHRLGFFDEYRWAFSLEDLVYGVGHNGPAVLGINWYTNMYRPDSNGFITASGSIAGGHAILAGGVKIHWLNPLKFWRTRTWDDVDKTKSYIKLYNSWGATYGSRGWAKIRLTDMEKLMGERGEAVFMLNRKSVA